MSGQTTARRALSQGPAGPFISASLVGLDEPVRRYFRHAISDGIHDHPCSVITTPVTAAAVPPV